MGKYKKIIISFIFTIVLLLPIYLNNFEVFALSGDDLGVSMDAGKMGDTNKDTGKTTLYAHDNKKSQSNLTDSINDKTVTGTSFYNKIFANARTVIFALSALGTLTSVLMFIVNFVRLGAAEDNPTAKSQAIKGLLHTGLAACLLGGITLIVGISYNLLK